MSSPMGGAGVSPGDWWLHQGAVAPVSSMQADRSQDSMTGYYQSVVQDSPGYNNAWAALDSSGMTPDLVPGMDASKITSGVFADSLVPSVGELRDAIWQAFTGGSATGKTAADVKAAIETWKTDIEDRISELEDGPL